MKKSLGVKPYAFPMPVLMIATYGEDDAVDVMTMAWGGICAQDMIALNIDEAHKTTSNIKERKAFTVSIADVPHLPESDYFGMVSANKVADKFARTGMHAERSEHVDAPVVQEYPVTLECEAVEMGPSVSGYRVVGRIVNVLVDEVVLDDEGKVDPSKLNAFVFDQFQNGYYAISDKISQAWDAGKMFQ